MSSADRIPSRRITSIRLSARTPISSISPDIRSSSSRAIARVAWVSDGSDGSSSSRCPRTIVIGVFSSCCTSSSSRRWLVRAESRRSSMSFTVIVSSDTSSRPTTGMRVLALRRRDLLGREAQPADRGKQPPRRREAHEPDDGQRARGDQRVGAEGPVEVGEHGAQIDGDEEDAPLVVDGHRSGDVAQFAERGGGRPQAHRTVRDLGEHAVDERRIGRQVECDIDARHEGGAAAQDAQGSPVTIGYDSRDDRLQRVAGRREPNPGGVALESQDARGGHLLDEPLIDIRQNALPADQVRGGSGSDHPECRHDEDRRQDAGSHGPSPTASTTARRHPPRMRADPPSRLPH